MKDNRPTKKVEHSGETFEAPKIGDGYLMCPRRSCTKRCNDEDGIRRHLSEQHNIRNHVDRICEKCGSEFTTIQNNNQRFCSRDCAAKHSDKGMPDTCQFCGKTIPEEQTKRGYCNRDRCKTLAKLSGHVEAEVVADD